MTEAEWRTCEDPTLMLEFLQGKASDRKLRLFAVACCRRIERLLPDERSRAALDAAEGYSDRIVSTEQLVATVEPADAASLYAFHYRGQHFFSAAGAALFAALPTGFTLPANWTEELRRFSPANVCEWASGAMEDALGIEARRPEEHAVVRDDAVMPEGRAQRDLLHDIFGPLPFRPVTIDPCWLTSTVVSLARQMYESRDFSPIPILADALQDAGCDNDAILNHCRGEGVHVRGCFVVDLVRSVD
jgi:hypothetical protein